MRIRYEAKLPTVMASTGVIVDFLYRYRQRSNRCLDYSANRLIHVGARHKHPEHVVVGGGTTDLSLTGQSTVLVV